MTQEQFLKAVKLNQEIKELETFQKAFSDYSSCSVWATNVLSIPPLVGHIDINTGDELRTIISDYVSEKLDKLKAEIENL